ncbi:hypothetical protein NL676_037726 [Syzygium grande]|nr:hypothetical protein NL676_037726 [Syzygium grande]
MLLAGQNGRMLEPTHRAAAPGSMASDDMSPLAAPITISTPVSTSALIIAGSALYSLTFPIVVDPRSLTVDSMSEKLRHPFLARLDSLDKSDKIQLKSCKFHYSTSEESTQRERGIEHWTDSYRGRQKKRTR